MTMRQSALLAMRSPPRLRRCRLVFPDDAGTGDATQAGERGVGTEALRIVAGGDQESPSNVWTNAGEAAQRRCGFHGQAAELTSRTTSSAVSP